jgi:hypothetical protein
LAGADEYGLDSVLDKRTGEDGGSGTFPDRTVGAEDRDSRAGYLMDAATERMQILFGARLADVEKAYACSQTCRCEFRIVVQEFVEPVDDIHPQVDRFEKQVALVHRQDAARRRHPVDEIVGHELGVRQRVLQVAADRD